MGRSTVVTIAVHPWMYCSLKFLLVYSYIWCIKCDTFHSRGCHSTLACVSNVLLRVWRVAMVNAWMLLEYTELKSGWTHHQRIDRREKECQYLCCTCFIYSIEGCCLSNGYYILVLNKITIKYFSCCQDQMICLINFMGWFFCPKLYCGVGSIKF